jgi:CheY-like chemotaxis protein
MPDTVEKSEANATEPGRTLAESRQHHLLCVDDEKALVLLTAEILAIHGYRVTALSNSLQAAEVFDRENIELAVLDYEMPQLSGICLAAQLKSARSKVKVVLFTGALQVPAVEPSLVDAVVHKSDGVQVAFNVERNIVEDSQLRQHHQLVINLAGDTSLQLLICLGQHHAIVGTTCCSMQRRPKYQKRRYQTSYRLRHTSSLFLSISLSLKLYKHGRMPGH